MPWWSRLRDRSTPPGDARQTDGRRPGLGIALGLAAATIGVLLAAPRVMQRTPSYETGQFTDRSVRAPFDFSVADEVATARKREEAARTTPPVAALDAEAGNRIAARISSSFAAAREALDRAAAAEPEPQAKRLTRAQREALAARREAERRQRIEDAAAVQLARMQDRIGLELSTDERRLLAAAGFRTNLEDILVRLVRSAYGHSISDDAVRLRQLALDSADATGARIVIRDAAGRERTVSDLGQIDDLDSARQRVRRPPQDVAPESLETHLVMAGLASRLLSPNLIYDANLTDARRRAASGAVLPVRLGFRRNQLIIGEGQEVTREAQLVLDELRSRDLPRAIFPRWLAASAFGLLLLYVAIWPTRRMPGVRQPDSRRNAAVSLVGVLLTAVGFWLWLLVVDALGAQSPGVSRVGLTLLFPIPASAMLVSLVGNRRDGLSHLLVVAILAGLLSELETILALQAAIAGLVGIDRVAGCSRRGCVVRAGLAVGAAGMVGAAALLAFAETPVRAADIVAVLAGALLGGTVAGLVVVALSSVVESLFGYTTNIRLVELLSYEHPLLRRLATEAPGTFQHCISAAVLGSAAAEAVGAHALLVRVGTLYHDVGKLERPALFTENQRGLNPHDQLDAEESARLIRAHVQDGLALIRERGIGERIADFVREHHGTGTLAFFLAQAEERGATVDRGQFRYPGPRPRSKETAILMIADQVEATARSMEDATEADYDRMVERTIERIRREGELDDAPLTLGDLRRIREALVSALVDSTHRRVAYPPARQESR
ncbi:MAG: HDIG domain-containing metalloprotein [Acidobacteriota bacterium]